jgi:hypothetical protein
MLDWAHASGDARLFLLLLLQMLQVVGEFSKMAETDWP